MPAEDAESIPVSATAPGQLKVGDVGRYRLIAELARGGMGVVYLALVRGPGGFNKLFVVKELKTHLSEDPNLVTMFLEEARLAAKLNHPNVVQTIEVGSDGPRHFIAMEFLDGQSLHRLNARSRRTRVALPLASHLYVLARLLEGLQYAHDVTDFDGAALNIVHRDVSPHNVFLAYDGQVKVLDFGIAKALDSSQDTRTGVLKGKVAYMAPEQAAGDATDRRADLYSVGVMLWETVVGERMWSKATNDLQILHALTTGRIPRVREVNPNIDPALAALIEKATAFAPADRFATAAELQLAIEEQARALPPPSPNARALGLFLGEMFARERTAIKAVIDDQIRTLRGTTSGEYSKIDLPKLTPSTAPSGTPSGILLTGAGTPAPFAPVRPAAAVVAAPSAAADSDEIAPPKSRGPVVAVLGALGLAVVAAVAWAALHGDSPQVRATALTATSAIASGSAAATVASASSASAPKGSSATASANEDDAGAPAKRAVTAPRWPAVARDPRAPTATPDPTPASPPPPPPPAATPVEPPPAPAAGHAKQQIDTHDPYAN